MVDYLSDWLETDFNTWIYITIIGVRRTLNKNTLERYQTSSDGDELKKITIGEKEYRKY